MERKKKAGLTILTPHKTDFKTKDVTRDREGPNGTWQLPLSRSFFCAPLSTSSATVTDKSSMTEIEKFKKSKLKTPEMQEKNSLPSKETIEQEKQAGKAHEAGVLARRPMGQIQEGYGEKNDSDLREADEGSGLLGPC